MIIYVTPLFFGKPAMEERQCQLVLDEGTMTGSVFFDTDFLEDGQRVPVNGLRLRWTPKGFTVPQSIDIKVLDVNVIKGSITFNFRQPITRQVMESLFEGVM